MTRDESIQILQYIGSHRPMYFSKFSKEQKNCLIDEWTDTFLFEPFSIILEGTKRYMSKTGMVPYARKVKQLINEDPVMKEMMERLSNPWYQHFQQEGIIEYSDEDITWASWDDWRVLPDELGKRLKYVADPNDEKRNELIQEAKNLANKILGGNKNDQ